jgi:BirA family biotin operon repressor/biotin-[acetyl-CoA-carboxylase] ligase
VSRLQEGLCTKRFGRSIFFRREVSSTNDWAKELAAFGAAEGTVAIAETQTSGRGRLGRKWVSPKGGLWFSVILRPELTASRVATVTFAAGVAVAEALQESYGLKAETKWPNDMMINNRKVCGTLSETSMTGDNVNYLVLGIGINGNFDTQKAFSDELGRVATSLQNELRRRVSLEESFRVLLEKLESTYDLLLKEGFEPVLRKWKDHAGFLGRRVEVANETGKLQGTALDIDSEGALVIRLEEGTVTRILVGDVTVRTEQ